MNCIQNSYRKDRNNYLKKLESCLLSKKCMQIMMNRKCNLLNTFNKCLIHLKNIHQSNSNKLNQLINYTINKNCLDCNINSQELKRSYFCKLNKQIMNCIINNCLSKLCNFLHPNTFHSHILNIIMLQNHYIIHNYFQENNIKRLLLKSNLQCINCKSMPMNKLYIKSGRLNIMKDLKICRLNMMNMKEMLNHYINRNFEQSYNIVPIQIKQANSL